MKNGKKMVVTLVNVALLVLSLLIIFSIYRNVDFLSKSKTTVGVVTERVVISSLGPVVNQQGNLSSEARDKGQEYMKVEFETENGAINHVQHSALGVSIGDKLTIRYDPQKPEQAFVDKWILVWIRVIILGSIFLALLLGRFILS
ncbi:MAG: DUF3592 domain-containing protein [Opitutaceae bacterium]